LIDEGTSPDKPLTKTIKFSEFQSFERSNLRG